MKKRKGGTLIFTIVLLLVLSILAIAIINIAYTNFKSVDTKSNNLQAELVARSGLDLASQYIIDDNTHFKETLDNNDEMIIYYVFNSQDSNSYTNLPSEVKYSLPATEYSVTNDIVHLKPTLKTTASTDLNFIGANGVSIVSIKPDKSHKDNDISEIRYTLESKGYFGNSNDTLSLVLLEDNTAFFAEETGVRLFEAGYILKKVDFVYSDDLSPIGNEGYSLPATRNGGKRYIENKLGLTSISSSSSDSTYEFIKNIFPDLLTNSTTYELSDKKDLIVVLNNSNYTLSTDINVFDFESEDSIVLDRAMAILFDGTITLEGYFPPNVKLALVGIGSNAKVVINDKTKNGDFVLNAHILAETVVFGSNTTFDPTQPDGFPSIFTGAILTNKTNVKTVTTYFTNFSDPYYFFNMMYAEDSNGRLKSTVFDFPLSRSNPFLAALTPTDNKQTFTKNEYSN